MKWRFGKKSGEEPAAPQPRVVSATADAPTENEAPTRRFGEAEDERRFAAARDITRPIRQAIRDFLQSIGKVLTKEQHNVLGNIVINKHLAMASRERENTTVYARTMTQATFGYLDEIGIQLDTKQKISLGDLIEKKATENARTITTPLP